MSTPNHIPPGIALAYAQLAIAEVPTLEKSLDAEPLPGDSYAGYVANPIYERQLANARQALATFIDSPGIEKSLTEEEFVAQHAQDLVFDEAGLQQFSTAVLEKGMSEGLPYGTIEATLLKAREGLVKKTITTKSGHTATRWVKAGEKPAAAKSESDEHLDKHKEHRASADQAKKAGDEAADRGEHGTASRHYVDAGRHLAMANSALSSHHDARLREQGKAAAAKDSKAKKNAAPK